MKKNKRIHEVYVLRRSDKEDPLELGAWQPLYFGKGQKDNGRKFSHRREALKLLKNPNAKNTNPIKNRIIHKLWAQGLDYIEESYITDLTEEEALYYEKECIATYGRIDLGTGCLANLTDGGEGVCGIVYSEETRKLWSEQRSGENNSNWGKPLSDEHKEKLRVSNLGRTPWNKGIPHTEEHRRKLCENHADFSGENNPTFGIPKSEEHKEKLREASIKWWEDHPEYRGENHHMYGTHPSEETRKKQSDASKGENNYWWGKTLSDEHKNKMSIAKKGKKLGPHSEEHKRKLSESNTGQTRSEETKQRIRDNHADQSGENNPFHGKTHSEESKRKISLSRTKNRRLIMLRTVIQLLINQQLSQMEN